MVNKMIVSGKIVSASLSSLVLGREEKKPSFFFKGSKHGNITPSFHLSEAMKDLDRKRGKLVYIVANTAEGIDKQIEKGRSTNCFEQVVMKVTHKHMDTDIDTWFESSVSFDVANDGSKLPKNYEFGKLLEGSVGKYLYVEFVEA